MARKSLKTESVLKTLKERIDRGEYRERPFPSERKLASQLGVSHTTVRKAIQEAVLTGLLNRTQTGRIEVANQGRHLLQFALICPADSAPWLTEWKHAMNIVAQRHQAILRVFQYVDGHDSLLADSLVTDYDLYFLVAPNPMNPVIRDLICDRKGRIATIVSNLRDLDIPCIDNSSETGVEMLLEHLTSLGHQRIACVNCETNDQSERVYRYQVFCKEKGIPELYIAETHPLDWIPPLRAYRFLQSELRKPKLNATAYLFTTIEPCLGALRACHEAGVSVGKDISICGFGPSTRARLMIPSVTSLQTPLHETVLSSAVDAMMSGSAPFPSTTWKPGLYIGESTAPLTKKLS